MGPFQAVVRVQIWDGKIDHIESYQVISLKVLLFPLKNQTLVYFLKIPLRGLEDYTPALED